MNHGDGISLLQSFEDFALDKRVDDVPTVRVEQAPPPPPKKINKEAPDSLGSQNVMYD